MPKTAGCIACDCNEEKKRVSACSHRDGVRRKVIQEGHECVRGDEGKMLRLELSVHKGGALRAGLYAQSAPNPLRGFGLR
jgi:hypothetical protein